MNKRHVPDYYEVIKEPMALSILKQKINKREYKDFPEFVRDCALVCDLWKLSMDFATDRVVGDRYGITRRHIIVPSRARTRTPS